MTNPKRASMREGPLAALFRKTEDLEKDPGGEPSRPDAATAAAATEPSAKATTSASPAVPSAPAEPVPAQVEHPRDSGVPHPSLRPEPRRGAAGGRADPQPPGAPAPRLLLGDPRQPDGPSPCG